MTWGCGQLIVSEWPIFILMNNIIWTTPPSSSWTRCQVHGEVPETTRYLLVIYEQCRRLHLTCPSQILQSAMPWRAVYGSSRCKVPLFCVTESSESCRGNRREMLKR